MEGRTKLLQNREAFLLYQISGPEGAPQKGREKIAPHYHVFGGSGALFSPSPRGVHLQEE
jgi:hypothetical protein